MQIDYISDLHVESWVPFEGQTDTSWREKTERFLETVLPEKRGEFLIIAGDISHYDEQYMWTVHYFRRLYQEVVLILGNHDCYVYLQKKEGYRNAAQRIMRLEQGIARIKNVHLLMDFEVVTIAGIRVSGGTNWRNIRLPFYAAEYRARKEDKLLHHFKIKAAWTKAQKNLIALESVDILVTHYPFSDYNSLPKKKPAVLIEGHLHGKIQTTYGEMRILKNAIGRPTEDLQIERKIATFIFVPIPYSSKSTPLT